MTQPALAQQEFTYSLWAGPQDKAWFVNEFVAFVQAGFPERRFRRRFYELLCKTFGYTSCGSRHGFWQIWLDGPDNQQRFLTQALTWEIRAGDHLADVEQVLQQWLQQRHRPAGVDGHGNEHGERHPAAGRVAGGAPVETSLPATPPPATAGTPGPAGADRDATRTADTAPTAAPVPPHRDGGAAAAPPALPAPSQGTDAAGAPQRFAATATPATETSAAIGHAAAGSDQSPVEPVEPVDLVELAADDELLWVPAEQVRRHDLLAVGAGQPRWLLRIDRALAAPTHTGTVALLTFRCRDGVERAIAKAVGAPVQVAAELDRQGPWVLQRPEADGRLPLLLVTDDQEAVLARLERPDQFPGMILTIAKLLATHYDLDGDQPHPKRPAAPPTWLRHAS